MPEKFDYTKTVKVLDWEQYDSKGWIPENLIDAIHWLQEILDGIPVEYRPEATIEIGSSTFHDSSTASILIEYQRPPTAEEIEERKQLARKRAEEEMMRLQKMADAAKGKLIELASRLGK